MLVQHVAESRVYAHKNFHLSLPPKVIYLSFLPTSIFFRREGRNRLVEFNCFFSKEVKKFFEEVRAALLILCLLKNVFLQKRSSDIFFSVKYFFSNIAGSGNRLSGKKALVANNLPVDHTLLSVTLF